ncbi:serine/threonine-protein kinase [Streptomyces avermitilis]|uniref:serine/threonine-protein kinase n=1 Tax=Streptomyces avermitilis TaxID=33903 RepID=UPI0033D3E273
MTMGEGQISTQELIAGRYRPLEVVHREEGRVCWLGEDLEFGRPVSLTESRLATHPRDETPRRTTARILRESETMALLCPGRVATVVDVVEEQDALWTITEQVGGTFLGELLERGPVNYVRAARIGLGILEVLDDAHRRGVTHGDLSPGQVLVQQDGGVVLTGFGLIGASPSQRVTAPSYASPEQARGETAGPASDQWALGALLYAMVEGRPPFRDRGQVEATLRAVERLPLRSPVSAGPLAPAITGLLRRSPLERVPEPVVRDNLVRILNEDPDEPRQEALLPRFRGAWVVAHGAERAWSRRSVRRSVLLGAAAVVVASSVAVYAATDNGVTDGGTSATGAAPGPSPSASPSDGGDDRTTAPEGTPSASASAPTTASVTRSPSPSPSRTTADPAAGFQRYDAPEGFSVSLPKGWKRLRTVKGGDVSYRVTFGRDGDPRTLAITYSERLGTDPVSIWETLDRSLRQTVAGYKRIGDIKTVDYHGREGADMEWLAEVDGVQERTFGRGYLIAARTGFSLRWTAPADDWNTATNQQALDTVLRTFRDSTD